jgi:hypothetical protein
MKAGIMPLEGGDMLFASEDGSALRLSSMLSRDGVRRYIVVNKLVKAEAVLVLKL